MIIDMLYGSLEKQKKSYDEKVKELINCEVKLSEPEKKLEQFRNSSTTLTSILSRQRTSGNSSGLGYKETPPPFNNNFSFFKSEFPLNDDYESPNSQPNKYEKLKSNDSTPKPLHKTFISSRDFESTKNKSIEETYQINKMETLYCFKYLERGHVASVCTNKRREAKEQHARTIPPQKVKPLPTKPVQILRNPNKNVLSQMKDLMGAIDRVWEILITFNVHNNVLFHPLGKIIMNHVFKVHHDTFPISTNNVSVPQIGM